MARRVIVGWDEQDAYTGWRRYLFWQRGELRRIKRRTAKRDRRWAKHAAGGEIAEYRSPADHVMVRLSPGQLWPACCPGVTLVDHDDVGPAALLIEHYHQAHGRRVVWRTDTPANDAPTGPSGQGDRESNAGG